MKQAIFIFCLLGTFGFGQGIWLTSGRTHPELHWSTVSSPHFNIHYHQGLEKIADRALSIAEQSRSTLMKQVGLSDLPKIDITLTAEDEVMNGYAMWSNTIFIWVDQNDAALWLEDQKWLRQVMTHELQHVVFFHAIASPWLPEPWNFTVSGIPGWFVEGLAEYMTEHWRPYRADLSHKIHILQNKTGEMDPHHQGYSKLLYLADRFGDSTIVNIIHYRSKLKTANFKKGFKKYTGISVEQFNEDWRRYMNTYYYGYRAQKETIEEVGRVVSLPMKEEYGLEVAPDSMRIAVVSRLDKDHLDQSLMIATRDTTKKKTGALKKVLKKIHRKNQKKKKKSPLKWKTEELDYGRIHPTLSWSPDGKKLAYAKFHYGVKQSLVWDLRLADLSGKKPKFRWITRGGRALHPDWSPAGDRLVYVRHERNISNLMTVNPESGDQDTLTHFTEDTQILTPRWSPDGNRIAMALSGADGNLDIAVLDLATGNLQRITHSPKAEYSPVWHPDGTHITYTSHAGNDSLDSAPNLFTVDLSSGKSLRNTDVGDAVWSVQWTPGDSTVLATTLSDPDTVRLVKVDPHRRSTTLPLRIRPAFSRWQNHHPPDTLTAFDPTTPVGNMSRESYRFYQHPRHLASLVFPYLSGNGLFGT
ncbi:MAG: hypothetical protein ACE5D1_01970, partial [Fidelibacterota bacterium]